MSAPSAILKVLVLRLGLSHQTTICPVSVYKLKQAYRLTGLQAYRLTGLQAYRLTGLQAYRLTGLQAYRLISRRADILRFDIKRQDLGPRQPADSGKVVAANAGCGWLKQRNEFDTATT
jgi:hypothetical protein